VRVRADRSDDVLRWLLGAGGVHVQRVTAEPRSGHDEAVIEP
jgi:hypothetical protein